MGGVGGESSVQNPDDAVTRRRRAFAAQLRLARGDRPAADVARAVGIKRARLSDYEHARYLPSRPVAEFLDAELGQQGDLLRVWEAERQPRASFTTTVSDRFEHLYPASYVGPVWIAVRAKSPAMLTLAWGPWIYQRGAPVTDELWLRTGKGFDVASAPLVVQTDGLVSVAFGTGVGTTDAEDIHLSWLPRQGWAIANAAQLLISVLTEHGRDLGGFAEFLGVDRATLDTLLGGMIRGTDT